MTDTHTHIYLIDDYPGGETNAAVKRAVDAGVTLMILPGVDIESIPQLLRLHADNPLHTAIAIGLHPTEVQLDWRDELKQMFNLVGSTPIVAVGEIGLDCHEDFSNYENQKEAFAYQVKLAHDRNLPIIIHQREALADTLKILQEAKNRGELPPSMVFHCFTGNREDVMKIRSVVAEAYFGIGGVATFKSAASLREALLEIGISRIVLETDAPWLAPVPKRGKRNESAYIPHIACVVADTLGMTIEEVERITDANASKLFSINVHSN
ncbi:MAG: TatD family hydrolase [Muribaculaceae bacterium]|nr:TatD family hydrolase [Muribaculaceae bacterium]